MFILQFNLPNAAIFPTISWCDHDMVIFSVLPCEGGFPLHKGPVPEVQTFKWVDFRNVDLLPPKPMAELYADDIVTNCLTHWDRSMHIINKLAIIGSDNGLSAGQPQAIIWAEFLAATKQLYDWFSPSVRLSVRPSVRLSVTPFSPCSHHRIIIKFSGVITMVISDVHAKGQGQRSKVKVTEVNTQLSRFRTLTPVWIHIWQWNHAHT